MSLTGITAYLRPQTLEEAHSCLGSGALAVAGGTDVLRHTHVGVHTLVDLSALPLRYIREEHGFALGANATLTDLLEHPGLTAHLDGVVVGMLGAVGSPLLRNAATIGGHLARRRHSDIVPVLLALDAGITIYEGSERTLPLAQFYAEGTGRSRALITEVQLPPAGKDTAAAFLKFSRTVFDFALLNCAVLVRRNGDGQVDHCRIVVGETPALGASVPEAEDTLRGTAFDDASTAAAAEAAVAAVAFGGDQRAAADYRQALCRVAVRRCLQEARRRLEERRR
jgi:putative selenate reductase FAD-binding subunit